MTRDISEKEIEMNRMGSFLNREIATLYFSAMSPIHSEDGKIERFDVNGEMASVAWYRQGNHEYNGKYVTKITYKEQS